MRQKIDLKAAVASVADTVAAEISFSELVKAYSAVQFDGADLRLRKWVEAFGHHSAWELTTEMLANAADAMLGHGYKPSSVNRDTSSIGTIYRWAARRRLCPKGFRSPTIGLERFEEGVRVVSITSEEIGALLAGAHAFSDKRFAPYVRLLAETGCRKGELLGRRWCDVDLASGQILVETTKTGVPRVLFFSVETAELMKRVWPKRDADRLLFEGRIPGKAISYRRQWAELTTAVGRPDLHQHDLRHYRAAELLKAGNTIAVASQVLGHSSLILQRRYGHLETAHLRSAMQASWRSTA